ncbi:unnamed protein product [Polarella glacialis]|uniref:Uncharacterized protein n=1 Tax=Polarella glacialis TaxID=89957 RepID=A0A813DRM1_POLGL|nr:unnamed protein product [Polarella glacialis]
MTPKLIRDFISVLNERRTQTRLGFMSYNAGLASMTHFCTLPATCCTAMLKQHRGPRGPRKRYNVAAWLNMYRAGQGQSKAAGELGQVWTQTKQPACIEYRVAVSAPAN